MGKHLDAVGNASSTFHPLRKEQCRLLTNSSCKHPPACLGPHAPAAAPTGQLHAGIAAGSLACSSGWPGLANKKNTGHPVKFEFHVNRK